MRILSHYFAARFVGLFFTVLVASLLILATVELVLNLEDVTGIRGSDSASFERGWLGAWASSLRYLGLRLSSYYLSDVLPIASFVAVFVLLAGSGRAMELIAIQSGGIPPSRAVLPVLVTALILSFASVVLHETLILRADQIWSRIERDLPIEAEIDFARRSFWVQNGLLITNVGHADPVTRTLHDVEIFERSHLGAVIRVIRADRVEIGEDGTWHTDKASVWRFDPINPATNPNVQTGAPLSLDLDALQADLLLSADPALLPLRDLGTYLESDPRLNPSARRRIEARLHERLSSPWLILVFAWLAVPFALRVDARGHVAGPAVAAVTALALFFVCQNAGHTLAQREMLPVGIAPWATMGFFSLLSLTGLRSSAR